MTTTRTDLDTAPAVLGLARASRAAADRAEADLLLAAVTWAEQNPPESIASTATWPGSQGELTLAGEGAPVVAEFCIAELAAAIGCSTDAGRVLIAHALELKYRLPRTQRRVDRAGEPGGLAPWKARRIAEATLGLSAEAVAFVDAQVAPFAHRIGPAQLDRLVAEAIARFMPDQALEDAVRVGERRHVTFHHQQVSFDGTTFVEAELDLADALDLDAAISRGAEQLRVAGCAESLDVRRAIAAGDLARRQLALDLTAEGQDEPSAQRRERRSARQVVLHVHLSNAAICDCDHVVPYAQGGTTCSCNIAPLCRRHHRLKTHSPWTYTVLEPGTYLWSSPHGYQFLRNHHGTLDVSREQPPRRPTDPPPV